MPNILRFIVLSFLLNSLQSYGQFQFTGKVDTNFSESKAYLIQVDDYSKHKLFLTKNIVQEVLIDSLGTFSFSGNFLPKENQFYKIHIDKCNNDISDFEHLLNECEDSNSILFIANNKDSIYFPLNTVGQMFCTVDYANTQKSVIQNIDHLQENLLESLHETKNDRQRAIIFDNYIQKIQTYTLSLEDPLAELYAYELYANRESFAREYYLKNLKHSDYYTDLLERFQLRYPKSAYGLQYKRDLENDLPKQENTILVLVLSSILLISLGINFFFLRKKRIRKRKVNYKEVLSTQEQKVFEKMHKGFTNKEIAEELFISISTVKTHINTIYSKLGINSRKEVQQFFKN